MNKVMKFFLVAVLLGMAFNLLSVPAYPGRVEVTQPDGRSLEVSIKGDEVIHWFSSTDGYTLLYDQNGYLNYAKKSGNGDLVCTEIHAKDTARRSSSERSFLSGIEKNLFYSQTQITLLKAIRNVRDREQRIFPPMGSRKLVMILMGFTDLPFSKTQAEFSNLMNQANYGVNGAYGSVKKWVNDVSFEQLILTTDVKGPFTASHNKAYYGGNNTSGDDTRPGELVTEAVTLADTLIDYTEYDNDDDGNVDGVYVIYAGHGEESGGGADCIWSHTGTITPVVLDSVSIADYSCSAELAGSTGNAITNIGVICHEFSHSLGLPDLYDTDFAGSGGQSFDLGTWDPMATGLWNDEGRRPPYHNSHTLNTLGWQVSTNLFTSSFVIIRKLEENNVSYKLPTATANEYFLFENRQQISWDYYVPYHGMLVYHVDLNYAGWQNNAVNAVPTHQGLDLEEADDLRNLATFSGDPFPGTPNFMSFTDATVPNSKSWAGVNTNKPITNIRETSGMITFSFMGWDVNTPIYLMATTESHSQINLTWAPSLEHNTVMLAFSTTPNFGTPVNGTNYMVGQIIAGGGTVIYKGTGTSFNHYGLTPNTAYYYKLWTYYDNNTYSPGMTATATTSPVQQSLPYTQSFNNAPQGWTSIDNNNNNPPQVWAVGNFAGGLTGSGNYAFLNSDAYGAGGHQNADLISPTFTLNMIPSLTIQFKHYFESYPGSSASFYYSTNHGATWTLVQAWSQYDTTNPLTSIYTISGLLGRTHIIFKWKYVGSWAYWWCVDEVQITPAGGGLNPPTNFAVNVVPDANNLINVVLTWSPPAAKAIAGENSNQLTRNASDREPGMLDRDLTGYIVYRNGSEIQTITNPAILTYTDMNVPNGTYTYGVSATYSAPTPGESEPAGPIQVVINYGAQQIPLSAGWNMISLNVTPSNTAVEPVFNSIAENLQQVNGVEGIYIPDNPLSTLTKVSDGRAYFVKVSQADTLTVFGSFIPITSQIECTSGWNFVAYYPMTSQSVGTALQSVQSWITQVKGSGGIYTPANPYNTLTDMDPGKGYWLKLNGSHPLVYSANRYKIVNDEQAQERQDQASEEVELAVTVLTQSEVVLTQVVNGEAGLYLGAFCGEELRGYSELQNISDRVAALLQIFTETQGEELQFKLYNSQTQVWEDLPGTILSEPGVTIGNYQSGNFFILNRNTTGANDQTHPVKTEINSVYPNPFNPTTTISFSLKNDSEAKVEIYNIKGQLIKMLLNKKLTAGSHKIEWNGTDSRNKSMSSGVYFCKLTADGKSHNLKLMLIK